MAQIIQHKRGVLEDLSGVTANKGELLVVTGSTISALADGLVFVGNHSDLTSVNKILTGSSSPNMTSYDVGVNGLPFYNTTDKKLQILRNDGNIDIVLKKTSLDLDGTGLVSSSAQVQSLGGVNDSTLTITAGTNLSGGGTFTSNQSSNSAVTLNLDTDASGFVSGAQQILDLVSIDEDNFSSNSATKVPTQQSIKAYVDSKAAAQDNTDELTEGSSNLFYTDARVKLKIDADGVISGSDQVASTFAQTILDDADAGAVRTTIGVDAAGTDNSTNVTLAGSLDYLSISGQAITLGQVDYSSDISNLPTLVVVGTGAGDALAGNTTTITSTQAGNITTNNAKVGYTDALVKLKLDADTVISGSSQVTGLTNTQISGVNHSKIDFGGSELTSGSLGLVIGDGSATDTVNVGVNTLVFAGTANEITTAVTNNQVQIGLPDNVTVGGNMIISGNLTVSGDTVQTNTTTLNVEDNIINVNYGGSATDGGLYVSDVTGGNLTSGSILWDGTNDYWKAGAKDSEARVIVGNGTDTAGKITKFSADGVITDSIISESGTTVTISNDLILSGLTASSFLVSNGSKQLVSIASSTDGDFLVSNGSGTYSATNTIDGGTF